MKLRTASRFLSVGWLASACLAAHAQVFAPNFASSYSFRDLGAPAAVPTNVGGLTLKAGDSNSLLIGGAANQASGAIYSIGLNRTVLSDGLAHITSFSGTGTTFATAPFIDGGLAYGPGGVLFATTYSNNQLLQYKPGSTAPDKVIGLSSLGIASSTGTIAFSPTGKAVVASYNASTFYGVTFTADGNGTYDMSLTGNSVAVSSGPEGILYIPRGSAVFSTLDPVANWMLISEYGAGKISAYKADTNGLPISGSGVDFITGLSGAEGAAFDPVTSDFLFSTFGGGNRVLAVSGFALVPVPEPGTLALFAIGALGLGTSAWRKRRST